MKKIKKGLRGTIIASAFVAIAMLFSGVALLFGANFGFGTNVLKADVTASGTCGYTNVTWSYDADTKTLDIHGTGDMPNWMSEDSQPWKNFSITHINFGNEEGDNI
ncbi:MAG: hypothetical protein J6T39_00210, partial [Clostridia bacterium]|nr:hypothetical protein [Clostridia bacterium]